MKKFFSVSLITNKFVLSAERFPISILLIGGFTYLLLAQSNSAPSKVPYKLDIFFSFGAFISVSAILWLEDFVSYLKQHIITAVIVLLWGIYCFFLPDDKNIYTNKIVELVVIGHAAFLSVFFISFFKRGKDIAFWNFIVQMIFQFGLAVLFGGVIYSGLALAFASIEKLFDLTISGYSYLKLAILSFIFFAPLYFLANIPDKTAKFNEEINANKILKILALYILTPIVTIYAGILYIYLFKIIFTWQLPDGWVSVLVSTLAFGGLLIIILLYPLRLEGENKLVVFLSRYFGVIISPLLLLMTIGIFRRISDYGITIHRGYILLLNFWFYGIYIYIKKAQAIKWILISATVIALFFSIGFWSIPNITKHILTAELSKYLDNKKIDLSDNTFLTGINDRKKIGDKVKYLWGAYGKESVEPFFSSSLADKNLYHIESYFHTIDDKIPHEYISFHKTNKIWHIEKFNAFTDIHYNSYQEKDYGEDVKYSYKDGVLTIKIIPDKHVFSIPLKKIMIEHLNKGDDPAEKKKGKIYEGLNGDYAVLINEFRGFYYENSGHIQIEAFKGYLFYNK